MTSQGGIWQGNNTPLPRVVFGASIMGGSTLFMEMIVGVMGQDYNSKRENIIWRKNVKTTRSLAFLFLNNQECNE